MANPKLSKIKRGNIERDLLAGLSFREIQKKRLVSAGTISNVRHGRLAMDLEMAKLQRTAADANRAHKEDLKEIKRLQEELALFSSATDHMRHFRPVNIKPKQGGRGEATAMISLTDWHFEETVELAAVNGVNEFNLKIAHKRVRRLWTGIAGIVEMCRTKSRIDTMVLMLLGDLVNGWIHEEFLVTNSLTPPEATLRVFDELVVGLKFLLKETKVKELIVPCICGNHGRITQRKLSKKSAVTTYDWLIYQLLARWFEAAGEKKIRFVLPQGDMTYIKIYDRVIRLTHGDNIRYQGGIGGIHIPLRKALDRWNTCTRADYNYIGHWHTDLSGEDYRVGGSLVGYNEFCIRIKAQFQLPSQAFELQHPRYGSTGKFPIVLDLK